jgi:ABC-2 type transport system ATP-binding protein
MSPETSVHVESLTKRFGTFTAVDNVSFDIRAGEIWGFLGPNGAGKSTTIRILCGVLEPTAGIANVLGYDVARDPESVKLRIGYMSQGSSLWNDLTVEEHLRFYAGMFDLRGNAQSQAVHEWLERVGLKDRRAELAGALPGGFRKRLALACTLLHRPKMLFLDEPTAGVDPVSRREFWDLIVGFADEGTTVMVSTHYMDEAEHCNQLAFIFGGKVIARGTPDELKRSSNVGTTVEVDSSDAIAALDALDGAPFVLSAALYGASLHVTLRNTAAVDTLRDTLAAKNVAVAGVQPVVPSLEDVFAALVTQ